MPQPERHPPPTPADESTTMALAAIFVFLIVSALQLVDRYIDLAKKVSAKAPLPLLARCPSHPSHLEPWIFGEF